MKYIPFPLFLTLIGLGFGIFMYYTAYAFMPEFIPLWALRILAIGGSIIPPLLGLIYGIDIEMLMKLERILKGKEM